MEIFNMPFLFTHWGTANRIPNVGHRKSMNSKAGWEK